MGFGLGSIGKAFKGIGKSLFSKDTLKNLGIDSVTGGLWGPVTGFTGKGEDLFSQVHQGFANAITGGAIAQGKAVDEAKKARELAAEQYAKEEAAMKAAAAELSNLEEEKKKKLIAAGQKKPDTLYGSYTGLPGQSNVLRNFLG